MRQIVAACLSDKKGEGDESARRSGEPPGTLHVAEGS